MRRILVVATIFVLPHIANAADFSIAGTKLGMTDSEIIDALPVDLKPTAKRQILGPPDIPFAAVSVSAGTDNCEAMRWKQYAQPCTGYRSLLMQKDEKFQSISIVLSQYFERPVDIDVVQRLLVENYGEPSAKVEKRTYSFDSKTGALIAAEPQDKWPDGHSTRPPPFSPLPLWIWSPDLINVADSHRSNLFQPFPNVGSIGLVRPLMRVFINLDQDKVLGLEIILTSPVDMNDWSARIEQGEEAKRRNLEQSAEQKIKLK